MSEAKGRDPSNPSAVAAAAVTQLKALGEASRALGPINSPEKAAQYREILVQFGNLPREAVQFFNDTHA